MYDFMVKVLDVVAHCANVDVESITLQLANHLDGGYLFTSAEFYFTYDDPSNFDIIYTALGLEPSGNLELISLYTFYKDDDGNVLVCDD